MFIERLSQEQVTELAQLLVWQHEKYHINVTNAPLHVEGCSKECNLCRYELKNESFAATNYIHIKDFSCRAGGKINTVFVNYMYRVFGEEYKQAYMEHCMSIFEQEVK